MPQILKDYYLKRYMKTMKTQTVRKKYVQPQTLVFPVKMHAILCQSRRDYNYWDGDEKEEG